MFCKTYKCVILVCGVLALVGLFDRSASADGKKDDKAKAAPSGTWVRKKAGDGKRKKKIEFDGKGMMTISEGDSGKLAFVFDYTVEESGRIRVKVADFKGEEKAIEKAKSKVPVGLEFSFLWKIKEDSAKLDDLKGKGDVIEHLKEHLEGDYEKKK